MPLRSLRSMALACCLLTLGATCLAQYKVVTPDGRVTYTDRPPSPASAGQVTTLRRDGSVAPDTAQLPLELRQAAARFPVTLYTMAECAPCDTGRRLLQARGVPFVERLILDNADMEQLVRLMESRTVPVLTVGRQVLKAFSESEWHTTLDLATYPRESRLPTNYRQPQATALTPKAAATPLPLNEPTQLPEPAPEEPPIQIKGPAIRF